MILIGYFQTFQTTDKKKNLSQLDSKVVDSRRKLAFDEIRDILKYGSSFSLQHEP